MTGSLAPGTLLGDRYRIVRLIAEGGMGAVYEAQHLALGRRVAVKTLLSEFQDDQRLVQRFVREARATCTIAHSNVVTVLDIDQTPDGVIYFVMEYLEGRDLDVLLRKDGRLHWEFVREIALQVCAALAAAHDRGIVHRDLKPSNCFLVRDDAGDERVKLLDFGVAKVLESSGRTGPHGPRNTGRDLRWLKTSSGEVFGTLAYMAPEHLNGDPHDHRVDIYALGVILYEALTGATPFSPDAPGTFVQQVLYDLPVPPSQRVPDIPPDLDYVVLRALEKRPEDRFADMREFAEALLTVREHAAPTIAGAPLGWIKAPPVHSNPAASTAPPVPSQPSAPAAPLVARRPDPAPRARVRLGVLAGLVLCCTGAIVLASHASRSDAPPPAPVTVDASPTATPTLAATPPPAAPVTPSPVLPPSPEPAPEPAPKPAPEPAPATADDPPAETPPANLDRTRPAPRLTKLRPMTIPPFERHQLFSDHRDAISDQCKRPQRLDSAPIELQVTIEEAKIVRTRLASGNERHQAAANCIDKYLRRHVKVPARYSGRVIFAYTF